MGGLFRVAIVSLIFFAAPTSAFAAERASILFAVPSTVPAYIPLQLAKAKGYFSDQGLEIEFIDGKGGADVAKQVAVGNADVGCASGDTPIFVRAHGLPVKVVAMLGQGSLAYIIARNDRGIRTLSDLKGKRVGVVSFQNSNYYALLAVLSAKGIAKQDVSIEALGSAGVLQLLFNGNVDAISNVIENVDELNALGLDVQAFPVDSVFPALPQAIIASDQIIAKKPEMVKKIIRATLHAIGDIIENPQKAAADYVRALPQFSGRESFYTKVLQKYATSVYKVKDLKQLSVVDSERLAAVEKFYADAKIINTRVPLADLYTDDLVR